MAIFFLDHRYEVSLFGVGHWGEAEIINYQDMGFNEFADDFAVDSVSLGKDHLV